MCKIGGVPLTYTALIGWVVFANCEADVNLSSRTKARGTVGSPVACCYSTLITFLYILKYMFYKKCTTTSERSNHNTNQRRFSTFLISFWVSHPEKKTEKQPFSSSSTTSHLTGSLEVKGRRSQHPDKRRTNIPETLRVTMTKEEEKKKSWGHECVCVPPWNQNSFKVNKARCWLLTYLNLLFFFLIWLPLFTERSRQTDGCDTLLHPKTPNHRGTETSYCRFFQINCITRQNRHDILPANLP